jgi:hypothetical protein
MTPLQMILRPIVKLMTMPRQHGAQLRQLDT